MHNIVVYCGTRNHYQAMEVAAKSLLFNTPVDRVFFLIEDDDFPCKLPYIVSTVNVSGQTWFDKSGPNYTSLWTYMAFLRLAFAKLFPQYERVLYLDTDTLVLQDVSRMMSMNLANSLFAMVREDVGDIPLEICNTLAVSGNRLAKFQSDNPRPQFAIRPYCNSGVMLMNLDELRRSGMDDKMISELNTVKYEYPDQDVINIFCHDKIKFLPTEYNTIPALFPDFPQNSIRIKHFASEKPLWKSSLWQAYKRLSWNNVMRKQIQLKEGVLNDRQE